MVRNYTTRPDRGRHGALTNGSSYKRRATGIRIGKPEFPAAIFVTPRGTRLDPHNVRHACGRVLAKAKLPGHFTPHSLRHTYASILISEGKPIAYVQAQLGHASITLTVDTYGKWLPTADRGAVDSLHDTPWRQTPRIDAPRLVAGDVKSPLEEESTTGHDEPRPRNPDEYER
ncbi:MAG TPA: tyrosine-type recombinase/integrase [Gemmatimonadales bacterium]